VEGTPEELAEVERGLALRQVNDRFLCSSAETSSDHAVLHVSFCYRTLVMERTMVMPARRVRR
jgi:hypothetical protein